MSGQKQIAYLYQGVIKAEETEVDIEGNKPLPKKGDILLRPDGKRWKVEAITIRHDEGNALTLHSIYLAPEDR